MRQVGTWFILSCKRYLKKLSFFLILLVLPVITFWLRGVEETEGQEVRIAVYSEAGDGLEGQLAAHLVDEEKNSRRALFRFYQCSSEEQLREDVAARRAECGYVFSEGLREKLDGKNYRRSIRVYSAPSTVLDALSTEVVFGALMELYDREIFVDYVLESQVIEGVVAASGGQEDEIKAQLKEQSGYLYDKWLNNGSTFRFEYGYRSRGGQVQDKASWRIFPVRGIVAVYLFLVGLYSAVMIGYDEAKGLFLPLSHGKRCACSIAVLGAPVFLGMLSCLTALKTGGSLEGLGREIMIMAGYGAAVCVFSYGVKMICRSPHLIGAMIPFLLVGSLVFTPVFFDIRQFIPQMGWIERLFLPSYYLRAF